MTATEHVYRSSLERRVLTALEGGPQTGAELVRLLDVTYNVLYPILTALRTDGKITFLDARSVGHRGKGRRVYVYQRLVSGDPQRTALSKYHAVKTTIDGIKFDSKKEAHRYQELCLLEKAGHIRSITRQPRFALYVQPPLDDRVGIGAYVADFSYELFIYPGKSKECRMVVEDVKGFKTPLYRWKKKHVEAQYGIRIVEI